MTKGMKIELKRNDHRRGVAKFYTKNSYRIAVQGLDALLSDVSYKTVEKIDKKAMKNLYESTSWPPSIQGDSIKDNVRLAVMRGEGRKVYKGLLEYFSPHAAIVEYGGVGGVVETRGDNTFPVGMQQFGPGGVMAYAKSVTLQHGKHFLQRAVDEVLGSGDVETRTTFGLKRVYTNWIKAL